MDDKTVVLCGLRDIAIIVTFTYMQNKLLVEGAGYR